MEGFFNAFERFKNMLEHTELQFGQLPEGALLERPDGLWQAPQGGDPAAFMAAIDIYSGGQELRRRYEHLDSSTLPWIEGEILTSQVESLRTEVPSRVVSAVDTNPALREIELRVGDDRPTAEALLSQGVASWLQVRGEREVLRNIDSGIPPIYKVGQKFADGHAINVFFTRKDGKIESSPFVHVASSKDGDDALVLEELSRFGYGIHMKDMDDLEDVPDLSGILDAMHRETGTLLQPSLEALQSSFAKREAVVLMDGPKPIGYVRFSELLNEDSRKALDLPSDFPLIYETGSAIILPEYRGRHLYPGLRTRLLSLAVDRIRNKELLVLGTTKTPKVVESLDDANELGLGFEIVNPHDIPMVASFTCVCEGDFGNGFQNGSDCFNRATKAEIALIEKHDWKAVQEAGNRPDGKIPCTVYVSDLELANQMEDRLTGLFGSQGNLVRELEAIGHYE